MLRSEYWVITVVSGYHTFSPVHHQAILEPVLPYCQLNIDSHEIGEKPLSEPMMV